MSYQEQDEQLETIRVCLEQKVILMTRLLDVTKEIEQQSLQKEVDIASQLRIRHNLMERIDKCDVLIKTTAVLLSSSVADKLEKHLYDNDLDQIEFEEIYNNTVKWKQILERVKEIDARARKNLGERLEEARNGLIASRKNQRAKGGNLFRNR